MSHGPDPEIMAQRQRDLDALHAEHAHTPIPATCGECGQPLYVELWPACAKVDEYGNPHVCTTTVEGVERLRAVEDSYRRYDAETTARIRGRAR